MRVHLPDERYQQHVQLQHAAAAVPIEAIEFYIFDHGALLKVERKYTALRARRQSALVGGAGGVVNYPFARRPSMMSPILFPLR